VYVDISTSWLRRPQSDPTIFQWQAKYCAGNYGLAGFVQWYFTSQSLSGYHADYVWGEELLTHRPDPKIQCIYVFRRK